MAILSLRTDRREGPTRHCLSQWFSKCDLWTESISIGWNLLDMQILMSHSSSTEPEPLSFNKPPCGFDAGSSVRTTGLNHTRLIINDLLYKRRLCLCARKLPLNTVSKEKYFKWHEQWGNWGLGGRDLVWGTNGQREVLRGEMGEIRWQWRPLNTNRE